MKITFFNHYHRGDLFTHKEFCRDIKSQLPGVRYEYWHYNHPKVNADLQIPLTNTPAQLNNKVALYTDPQTEDIWINTWIGVHDEIFARNGGVNLNSLYESWAILYSAINDSKETNLKLKPNKFDYMPEIDYSFFDLSGVNNWSNEASSKRKVLICNGIAMSNQSFNYSMDEIISNIAKEFLNVEFVCTKKFESELKNVKFTDDIIEDNTDWQVKPHWVDRNKNNCDLNEISYLSTMCDIIIGKNSGPFVFCETKLNYLDGNKHIISFSKGSQESMSHEVSEMKCKYSLITDHTQDIVASVIRKAIKDIL